MAFDPRSCMIQGDLSRADAIELCRICDGRDVVEFGAGGSTLLLARCAASLHTWDTSEDWLGGTGRRVSQIPDRTCDPAFTLSATVPDDVPDCDVLWVDGFSGQRRAWAARHLPRAAECVILHDSRKSVAWGALAEVVRKHALRIRRIDMHPDESNLIVIWTRREPLEYENWNGTERGDSRVPRPRPDSDYVPDAKPAREPRRKWPVGWHAQDAPELAEYRAPMVHGRAASAMIRGLLTDRRACAIVSLGDAEVKWWAAAELSRVSGLDHRRLLESSKASGLCPEGDACLMPAFDAAVKASPILLSQYHWPAPERMAFEALKAKGLWGTKPLVSCNAVYKMHRFGDFFPVIEGRRVLIVGGNAGNWAERMADPAFAESHGASYEIVGSVQTPGRHQRPKAPHLPGILREIDRHRFDIALVAAGGLAFPICGHIAERRKFAFDCGAIDRMVLGEKKRGGHAAGFDVPEAEVPRNGEGV